ncbi:MAG: hypothetical protein RBJ76_01070 [Stenomitos frigidus ULC029]
MSICLEDLQALPLDVRPDKVEICFGPQAAYTIHVDEGVESPNPNFRSTPKMMANDLIVNFSYLIEADETDTKESAFQTHVVFQRDQNGSVVIDKLLDIFARSPLFSAA